MAPDLQRVARNRPRLGRRGGFTLVELLVSTAIMLIVILILLQVIAGMTNIWHNSTGSISTFQSARAAFNTITRTLSRATLKTYIDYVDTSGNPVTPSTVASSTFAAVSSFARASELQFISGPVYGANAAASLSPQAFATGHPEDFPGDCIFFQAPLGIISADPAAVTSKDKYLQRSLNQVGFFVEYAALSGTNTLPGWLEASLGAVPPVPRFRLFEYLEPSDYMQMYTYTATNIAGAYANSITFIDSAIVPPGFGTSAPLGTIGDVSVNYAQTTVLAENVVMLVFRPRLEPQDEKNAAAPTTGLLGPSPPSPPTLSGPAGPAYSATTADSIISPNYNYDSRAWWTKAPAALSTNPAFTSGRIANTNYSRMMRNQLPPIVDVGMIAVDPNSIIRYGTPATAPTAFVLPAAWPATGLYTPQITTAAPFTRSVNMDIDLGNYGVQLAAAHIRYRVFRASVQMEGAGWVNN